MIYKVGVELYLSYNDTCEKEVAYVDAGSYADAVKKVEDIYCDMLDSIWCVQSFNTSLLTVSVETAELIDKELEF